MDNNFIEGFIKTAGILGGTLTKITKVVKKAKKVTNPTEFPKAIHHPATVNIAKKMKGKEQSIQKFRENVGDKKFKEVLQMKKSKDIANYKPKSTAVPATPNKYQGTTHNYNDYRAEFKAKAIANKGRKF